MITGTKSTALLLILLLPVCFAVPAMSWTTVGNGIEYQQFTVSGPNNVFVTRMDRANTNTTIDTSLPYGKMSGGVETVRNQSSRCDDAINYWGQTWGQRNDVIAAVNGDFWNVNTLVQVGGQVQTGWYCDRFYDYGSDSGFAWSLGRVPFIGECVHHIPDKNYITFTASSKTLKFKDVNVARGSDELIIYTPQYDSTTKTDNSGVEVVVEMLRPTLILPSPAMAKGYVKQIRQNAGSTPIPFDCIILSATGNTASFLLSNVSIGAEIGVTQEIQSFDTDCVTALNVDWTKTYASIGGNFTFLRNSQVKTSTDPGLTNRNPRTAIAYNASYIYFIVVDGRDPGVSVGMSMNELASFCQTYLAVTDGINIDGGGSSTMVVNGLVKNKPSDGSERAVANGIMMLNVLPKQVSAVFTVGQTVVTNGSTNVRLGPGTNYAALTTVNTGTQGTIIDHSLKGIYAKGYYWWRVDFSGTSGWVVESLLNPAGVPVITAHPSPQTPCAGGSATFTVSATGVGTLTYQWQKDQINLANTGHYSNVTTPTLTVSNTDASDVGSYRCVVSNSYGPATSNAAALTLNQTPPASVSVTDEGNYTPSLTTLKASWSSVTNACGQPVNRYEYAIGTSPSMQDVKSWTSSGTATSVTVPSLALQENKTYYFQVRAVDNGGLIGSASASNGVTTAPSVGVIGAAWTVPDSQPLSLRDKVVTGTLTGAFWLEEQDRSAGIKVVSGASVTKGDLISVAGVLGISGAQRVLNADIVSTYGLTETVPAPLGITQKSLGGIRFNSSTPGVTGAASLYNIGLLVRTWGRVTYNDSSNPSDKFFFIDDGSRLSDGGSFSGIKIKCGIITPPAVGNVVVTGIIGTEQVNSIIVPIILIRDGNDIKLF